ncbi:MAG: hypothetical protein AABY78_04680 [Nitrospirota bacterium]
MAKNVSITMLINMSFEDNDLNLNIIFPFKLKSWSMEFGVRRHFHSLRNAPYLIKGWIPAFAGMSENLNCEHLRRID